jgi:pilus assembly protein CpaB
MRAIAVKVDEVIGVAGFVTPGMRVDVLVSGNPPEQTKVNQDLGTQVRTLLQNVEVLSAGQDIQKDAEGKPVPVQVVSLLVTPADAELLTLAASQTKIQLVLRNPLDTQVSKPQGSAMANIFAGMDLRPKTNIVSGPRKPVSQAPQPFVVEVFNGTARTEQKFSSKESKQ